MAGPSPRRHVTLDLIRRRSEHNGGLVATLEELALHQEELEAIGPVLGRTCGRTLRILLLQNNVISSLDPADLRPLRSLEYLNLALNNVGRVRGLDGCEFLRKLDLTLNFIDVDDLEESVDNLVGLRSLRELFLIGNPCAYNDLDGGGGGGDGDGNIGGAGRANAESPQPGWEGCRMYVVARLPRLQILDGREVLRSERIVALQRLPALASELRELAESKRMEKVERRGERASSGPDSAGGDGDGDGGDVTRHTPEARARISGEMARQKAEREAREQANQPRRRGEKESEEEQRAAVEREREREERGDVRQRNEGKWRFRFDEEERPGYVLLDVPVQKFLSSSLIDVDVHPNYVSIVIKSKVLRLVLPAEVKAEESTAQRSTTTGHLLVSMPKVDPKENMVSVRAARKFRQEEDAKNDRSGIDENKLAVRKGLASDMLEEATKKLKGSVRIDGIVKESEGALGREPGIGMKVVSSRRKENTKGDSCDEESSGKANGEDTFPEVDSDGPPMML